MFSLFFLSRHLFWVTFHLFSAPRASFGLPWTPLGAIWGSLWGSFGSLVPLFGSLWVPFGTPLAPLWLPFTPFGSRGAPGSDLARHLVAPRVQNGWLPKGSPGTLQMETFGPQMQTFGCVKAFRAPGPPPDPPRTPNMSKSNWFWH